MAPGFLSKLVSKATAPTHTRDRSDRSIGDSPRSSISKSRSRATSASPVPPVPPLPRPSSPSTPPEQPKQPDVDNQPIVPKLVKTNGKGVEESSIDTDSTFPNVTVVPPSPMVNNHDLTPSTSASSFSSKSANHRTDRAENVNNNSINDRRTINEQELTAAADMVEDDISTPTTPRPRTPSKANQLINTQTTSQDNPSAPSTEQHQMPSMPVRPLESVQEVQRQPSNRSLNRPPPVDVSHSHTRAATEPATSTDGHAAVYNPISPIVESPEAIRTEFSSPSQTPSQKNSTPPQGTMPSSSSTPPTASTFLMSPRRETDVASIMSTSTTATSKEKKRPWRRSAPSRKPTGLASAIAASSLAMANHSLTPVQQAQLSAMATASPTTPKVTPRKFSGSSNNAPYISPNPSTSSRHIKNKSAELSPRSSRSGRSARSPRHGHTKSITSDNGSEHLPAEGGVEYYSGLEDSDDDDDSSENDSLEDVNFEDENIPVTGFAVASNKRNADFHELFSSIPEGDYLIDDYGCALQREILIQGRLYISENHICFHANIFGWITDLSIPINEIVHLEKKMTAFVIPNAIQITTRQAKYQFASFLSRDTTYDVIYNIWRLERPDDASISSVGRGSLDAPPVGGADHALVDANGNGVPVVVTRKATMCGCGREGKHFAETALDTVVPGTPERIHNLIFASGFIKEFMAVNQKLMDIQISDWAPTSAGSNLLARNMSYIKPLNGSLGPKQTKCEIRDELLHSDFDDYVVTLTTTRTPDVPSGGVFAVKTRTCIMWASAVSTRIIVTTEVEWTGRSFIKGIIERSAIDGQKVYHNDLEKAMRAYIQDHQSEFIPEGIDPIALHQDVTKEVDQASAAPEKPPELTEEEERKKREHERNRRGLQWAWETFEGAYEVARRSTKGALELVQDAWEQSTATAILYFVIVILVFSNLWTLTRYSGRRDDAAAVRTGLLRREEEREKWVQGVVTALRDELGVAAKVNQQVPQAPLGMPLGVGNWREEVAQLLRTLDAVDDRVRTLRSMLKSTERLDSVD